MNEFLRFLAVLPLFIVAAAIMTAGAFVVIRAPFWIIAIIAAVFVLAVLGFIIRRLTQARGGEG